MSTTFSQVGNEVFETVKKTPKGVAPLFEPSLRELDLSHLIYGSLPLTLEKIIIKSPLKINSLIVEVLNPFYLFFYEQEIWQGMKQI